MKLCVLIPALNEEQTIGEVIRRIPRSIPGIDETVVIVVNDGSADATARRASEAGAVVINFARNRGVGHAFQAGVERALKLGADFVVNIDADGQFEPEDIPKLLAPLMEDRADFTTASRFIQKDLQPEMERMKLFGNRMMSGLISRLTGQTFYDVSCGFRAYTADTLLRLNLFGTFTYTQETFLELSFKGARILEVPLRIRGMRSFGKSRVASDLPHYAFQTSKIIFRSFRDYKPMRVFGVLAGILLACAISLLIFLGIHFAETGALSPHKWAGFTAAFLAALGFLTLVTGLLADMLARIRINQERMLYLLKRRDHNGHQAERNG